MLRRLNNLLLHNRNSDDLIILAWIIGGSKCIRFIKTTGVKLVHMNNELLSALDIASLSFSVYEMR